MLHQHLILILLVSTSISLNSHHHHQDSPKIRRRVATQTFRINYSGTNGGIRCRLCHPHRWLLSLSSPPHLQTATDRSSPPSHPGKTNNFPAGKKVSSRVGESANIISKSVGSNKICVHIWEHLTRTTYIRPLEKIAHKIQI